MKSAARCIRSGMRVLALIIAYVVHSVLGLDVYKGVVEHVA